MPITKEQASGIIMSSVTSILAQQKAKGLKLTWNQTAHEYMLRNSIMEAVKNEKNADVQKADILLVLQSGCAGNCSQFRQRLEKDKVIEKATSVTDEYQ